MQCGPSTVHFSHWLHECAPCQRSSISPWQTAETSKCCCKVDHWTKRFHHITPVLKELHWLPVCERIVFKVCTMSYKALNGTASQYIRDLLVLYTPDERLQSAGRGPLLNPVKHKSRTYGERRFSVAAPGLWNSLPQSIHMATSLDSFKKHLKTHLFIRYYG